jgi:hypothetical protein
MLRAAGFVKSKSRQHADGASARADLAAPSRSGRILAA